MVDEVRIWTKRPPFHRGSCHLTTDGTLDDLHAFAAQLGMKRMWFQDHIYAPHYDLVPARRAIALTLGAVYVTGREQSILRRSKGIGIGLMTHADWVKAQVS